MWITFFLVTIFCFSMSQAVDYCENVLQECLKRPTAWTRCYEDKIMTCKPRGRFMAGIRQLKVDSLQEVDVSPTHEHRVHIPSSALQRSRGNVPEVEVLVVASVINSSHFKLSPRSKGRQIQFHRREGTVFRGSVLSVKAGTLSVNNLQQPIKLIFRHDKEVENGTCVFWAESAMGNGTGYWSTEGCETSNTGNEFICSCNHLSFFAVLVNPQLSVSKSHSETLSYITYIGSALSVVFTFISLIIYICLHRRRPEKTTNLHMQLTGAMLCLHLSFLLSCFSAWLLNEDSPVCLVLGLILHWSLLATFSWTALEGFHLYLLLSRVFNITFRKYLLKLSLVGWGFPTLVAVICAISGVYGKYTLHMRDAKLSNTTAHICWMNSEFPKKHLITSFITTVAFPSLVVLFNACVMGLVVFKLWGIRRGSGGFGSNTGWKKTNKNKGWNLWKDSVKVLGLSLVLGLPWGLTSITYVSLPGIYVFTIFNSCQGVFMFLWSLALTRKPQSNNNSSTDTCQKKLTTSLNNS
ncbi:adhesion G-protein coupled receptor G1-like isoform X2 [Astatotilapia calliptera]|uniref:adhesion G-protein coupled receptor G1-like isoform X2 n=1 Tax=Astatotilapia calliptera TaxID=8154 RepID=UPI000E416D94|nr:adhesion G-protein coupled receptor G1-like isoform X2 [Astatotilapia calliptera]